MKRGYFGIAFYEPKFEENIGIAIRSSNCFGCDFICIIGKRFKKTPQDTMGSEKHIPIFEFNDMEDFMGHCPVECEIISVEVDGAENLVDFKHPERAIYLFGGEDRTLPDLKTKRVKIDIPYCLNMSVTASIVLYDRHSKN